jgi:hypothetical protein
VNRADRALAVLLKTRPGGYGSKLNARNIREFIRKGDFPTITRIGGEVVGVSPSGRFLAVIPATGCVRAEVLYERTNKGMRRTRRRRTERDRWEK